MNPENLKHCSERTPSERAEIARRGGEASAKAKRRKKAVRKILTEYLSLPVSSSATLSKIAEKNGIDDEASIKDLYVAICVINTINEGDIDDVGKLIEILGEDKETAAGTKKADDAITAALLSEAKLMEEQNADQP